MLDTFVLVPTIAPPLLLVWYFQVSARDAAPRAVWTTFLLGSLATAPVLLVVAPILALIDWVSDPYLQKLGLAFLAAAIPEEVFKLAVVWQYARRRGHLSRPGSAIAHGVAASVGFATLENLLYVSRGGVDVALLRLFSSIPCHTFLGVLMGHLAGRAVRERGRGPAVLPVPVLLHGLYCFPLFVLGDPRTRADALEAGLFPILAGLFSVVLVGGSLRALYVARVACGKPVVSRSRGTARLATATLVTRSTGRRPPREGAAAWVQIIVGFLVASLGGWVLGGLLHPRIATERLPDVEQAVMIVTLIGGSFLPLGLFLSFRGIRLRHRDRER